MTAEITTALHGKYKIVNTATRDEWHLWRNKPDIVTASQIARLATLTPASWEAVRREKDGGVSFGGNGHTDWGHTREASIINFLIEEADPLLEANDKLLLSIDNPAYAATPDAVDPLTGESTGQAKTTNKPLDPAHPGRLYADQVQWEIMVCQAKGAWLAAEEHDGNGTIIGTRYAYIEANPERQAELRTIADRFLAGEDPVERTKDQKIADAIDRYSALKDEEKELRDRLKEADEELKELGVASDQGEWSSGRYYVKRGEPTVRTSIDSEALEADYPEIFEKVKKTTVIKGRTTYGLVK